MLYLDTPLFVACVFAMTTAQFGDQFDLGLRAGKALHSAICTQQG
jgi:hypothetical protein